MTILALDLGGSKIAAALVADGKVLERRQVATPPKPDIRALIEAADAAARPLLGDTSRIAVATAGLAKDGMLDAVNRSIFRLSGPVPFAAMLEERLGRPAILLNDGAAAAWGEYRHGAGHGARSLVFMTISTGIGGGIIVDGRLLQGRQGLAGQLGFMTVERGGPPCGSGRHGTLEALAAGRALEAAAERAFGHPVTNPELFRRSADGDERAIRLLDDAAATTGSAIAGLVALIDPDRIVIGGGIGLATGYLARLRRSLETEPAVFRAPLVAGGAGR